MDNLSDLYDECWPGIEFPSGCSVSERREPPRNDDLAAVVDAVTKCGATADLCRKLRGAHPAHKPHLERHDRRLWDAIVEAEALAWADGLPGLGCGSFSFVTGAPDLHLPKRAWIEVKNINRSDAWWDNWNRSGGIMISRVASEADELHKTVTNKLQEGWNDAQRKFARVEREPLSIVYFSVRLEAPPLPRVAWTQIEHWLNSLHIPEGCSAVVTKNDNWGSPEMVRGAPLS